MADSWSDICNYWLENKCEFDPINIANAKRIDLKVNSTILVPAYTEEGYRTLAIPTGVVANLKEVNLSVNGKFIYGLFTPVEELIVDYAKKKRRVDWFDVKMERWNRHFFNDESLKLFLTTITFVSPISEEKPTLAVKYIEDPNFGRFS